MSIFKRFEVWLLLLLSMAGVGYVLWTESQTGPDAGDPDEGSGNEKIVEKRPRFEIREVRAVAEGDDEVIEIDLAGRNESAEPLALIPPGARLMAKYGDAETAEVPSFFLPFEPPPTLEPESQSNVTLKYWLQPKFGEERPSLTLEIDGESLELKL